MRLERRSKAAIFACEIVRKVGPTSPFLDWRTPNTLGVRQRRYPDLEQRARSKFDRPIHLLALTRHSLDLPLGYPLRVALLRNADARGAGRGLPANVRPRVISHSARQRARRPFERRSLSRSRSFPTGIGPYTSEFRRRCRLHSLANEYDGGWPLPRQLRTAIASSRRSRPMRSRPSTARFPTSSTAARAGWPQQTALRPSRAAAGSCDPKESRPPESCRGFVENATPAVQMLSLRRKRSVRCPRLRRRHRGAPSTSA